MKGDRNMSNVNGNKYDAILKKLPAPTRTAVEKIWKSDLPSRLGSGKYLEKHPEGSKRPGVTAKEADLMLECHKNKVSYRIIEVLFKLKKTSGMNAFRVCRDRRKAKKALADHARRAKKPALATAAA